MAIGRPLVGRELGHIRELHNATQAHLGRLVRYIRKTGVKLTKLAAEPSKPIVREEGKPEKFTKPNAF